MKKPRAEEQQVEADLLPVMNVMFLLIPALLLAMEFASMATIPVSPPRLSNNVVGQPTPPPGERLEFKVMIARDGFQTSTSGTTAARIPLDGSEYDYAALTAAARQLKHGFPSENGVTITAEGDVPMDVLVRTLDALRGDGCKLSGYLKGEQPDAACLFWSPVIESVG